VGAEVVIIGGGLEGLSVAWALTRRGVTDIVVFERATVGSGFTAKSSGIVRSHYGVPSVAAMAWRSLPVLEEAASVLGADIGFHRSGYLVVVGADNVEPLEVNVTMQQGLGIEVALVGPSDVGELFPAMRIDDCAAFAYEPRGGYADAYQTAQAFSQAARRGGARLRQGTAVAKVTEAGGRVTGVALASGEEVASDTVIVAAGPWSPALVAPLGVDLPILTQREQVMIVDPGRSLGPVPVVSDLVSLQYLRPEQHHLLLGNSDHHAPEWSDPDRYVNTLDDDHAETAIEKFVHRFPTLGDAGLSSAYAGCYDVTPDYNPVIGPAPLPGLFLCAGFSGHGFKISPAVGDLMADIICTGASTDPVIPAAAFRFDRFATGDLLLSAHPYAGAGEMR
jgi:glycine/D-amino acid oxidase-like deaminating enzyme